MASASSAAPAPAGSAPAPSPGAVPEPPAHRLTFTFECAGRPDVTVSHGPGVTHYNIKLWDAPPAGRRAQTRVARADRAATRCTGSAAARAAARADAQLVIDHISRHGAAPDFEPQTNAGRRKMANYIRSVAGSPAMPGEQVERVRREIIALLPAPAADG